MVGAAVRNARVPNDKLHRVTDKRLAEADRKDLHGLCWWSKLARYGGLPVFRAVMGSLQPFGCREPITALNLRIMLSIQTKN